MDKLEDGIVVTEESRSTNIDEASSTEEETESEEGDRLSDDDSTDIEYSHSNEELIKEELTNSSTEKHSGNVAFFVRDTKTGNVYGLTNRHITLQTDKIDVKIIPECKFVYLGTSIKHSDDINLDVGLIDIDPLVKDQLNNQENKEQHVCIYSDTFESIFNKEIFKHRPNERHYEVSAFPTPNCGIIVSESEHKNLNLMSKAGNGQFLVKSEHGDFAMKGESGTALATKTTTENVVELIGIICGGSDDGYTVCLFLPTVFQMFEESYGMTLEVYEAKSHGDEFDDKTKSKSILAIPKTADKAMTVKCIPFGVKIYFSIFTTPEQISPLSFNLVDHVLALMCWNYETENLNSCERLVKEEYALSLLVSDRGGLHDNAVFKNDRPDYVALENGLLACDYLYQNKAKPAEHYLKKAILGVRKTDDLILKLRLLCKISTYITWECLATNTTTSLHDLKKMLNEGIDSFKHDFKHLEGFPLETLGYMYFDYSRYDMAMWENTRRRGHGQRKKHTTEKSFRSEAVEKARQAVTIFQEDHNAKESAETMRRLVLAKCQQVYALLGCGHDFNTSEEVSEEEVKEAENIISRVGKINIDGIPLVQNVDYLIALCDLQYRKGHTTEALKIARKCLEKSRIERYAVGFNSATRRVKKLSQYKNTDKTSKQ